MSRRYFLMTWPNSSIKEGFYVQERNKGQFMLGHVTDNKREKYYQDHSHVIGLVAYESLKAQALRNRKRILEWQTH